MRSALFPAPYRDLHTNTPQSGDAHTHRFHHLTTPHFLSSSSSDPNWNPSGTNSQLRFAPDFAWLLRGAKNYKTSQNDTLEVLTLSCPNSAFTQKAILCKGVQGIMEEVLF